MGAETVEILMEEVAAAEEADMVALSSRRWPCTLPWKGTIRALAGTRISERAMEMQYNLVGSSANRCSPNICNAASANCKAWALRWLLVPAVFHEWHVPRSGPAQDIRVNLYYFQSRFLLYDVYALLYDFNECYDFY